MWNFLFLFLTPHSQWWVYLALPRAASEWSDCIWSQNPIYYCGLLTGVFTPYISASCVCTGGTDVIDYQAGGPNDELHTMYSA